MFDIPPNKHIDAVAKKLQETGKIKPPVWAAFVKTGAHRERPPAREDWWYVRAAAVLRTINRLGPIGTSKLRTKYGGNTNRGHKPDVYNRGGGSIIRKVLQQLQAAELVTEVKKGVHKGRKITGKGRSLLEKAAAEAKKS